MKAIVTLAVASALVLGASSAFGEECTATLGDGSSVEGRVFVGEVKSNKMARVTVDLRTKKKEKMREIVIRQGGDPVPFAVHAQAVVSGEGVTDAEKVKKGSWIKICGPGSALAAPRYAYTIEVIPEPADGAVEE